MWYNVENLFSTRPGFYNKVNSICKVIATADQSGFPDIVGLCEVEDSICTSRLCKVLNKSGKTNYRYVHYDSPDHRGIDVAMLYDAKKWRVENARPVAIRLDSATATRDLLYAKCCNQYKPGSVYHVIFCHLPSQLGGRTNTQWKRDKAFSTLQNIVDSVLNTDPEAQIIVAGDMNGTPLNNLPPLYNLSLKSKKNGQGTHKYQGIWVLLDQFYVSKNLIAKSKLTIVDAEWLMEEDKKYLGSKPHRSYKADIYDPKGYSDHLPVLFRIIAQ